jgi:hypothetical protein
MTDKIDLHSLTQTWVHSHEEDSPGEMIFRPGSYPMPPSRGRRSFQLLQDGQLRSAGPGPDDRIVPSQGTWSMSQPDVLTMKSAGGATSTMKILSVENDKLVVKKP